MDVNGLITKVTWKIEVLSDVGSKSMGLNRQLTKVTWRIENFSSIKDYKLCSESFTVDDSKWQLIIYPRRNNAGFLSIFLRVADSATLPSGWSRYARFGLAVIDQFHRENSKTLVTMKEFTRSVTSWGFPSFLPLMNYTTQQEAISSMIHA
ncbi:hypothetical protein Goari_003376 [Gossypium aridum]|uniref:MATH domain-containing protein n=1 Tax=Gossypium aridum TaxID=34290 RepID=A0A7J8YCT6_GOSAI|nr:hypothetical protein [Gossypium aridum]